MPARPWSPWDAIPSPSPEGTVNQIKEKLETIPRNHLALSAFVVGSFSTIATSLIYKRHFRRFRTSEWITPDVFAKRRWIRGLVTNVGDADNFRLYHTPGFGWKWPLKLRRIPSTKKDLKDQTLHIRIAGVDAPEAAHFGRPTQAYSAESLAWLKGKISGKTVFCQLLHRDQYSRIVANVVLPRRFLPGTLSSGKSLALEMLNSGWATTYEQAGAQYGPWGKHEFLRAESSAKVARRGMWKYGEIVETPAEYKRRYAQSANSTDPVVADRSDSARNGQMKRRGRIGEWWRQLWSKT